MGMLGNSDRLRSINSLIILLKYTIFKSRLENNLPTRENIVKIIAEHIEDEKTLASKAGKIYIYSFTFECRFILITLSLTFLCNIDYKAWITLYGITCFCH